MFLYNRGLVSGNANALAIGSYIAGAVQTMARVKMGSLAAMVVADVETTSLTMAGTWQGSNTLDFAVAVDLANAPQNPAPTVLATGTAGADAAVTKAFPAPDAAYSFRFVRFRLLTAGATGGAADTYAIGYCYRQ
jgi:hypothetical protein